MDDKVFVLNMKTAELDSLSNLYNKISGKSLNEILDDLYPLNNDYLKPEPYYAKYNKRRKKDSRIYHCYLKDNCKGLNQLIKNIRSGSKYETSVMLIFCILDNKERILKQFEGKESKMNLEELKQFMIKVEAHMKESSNDDDLQDTWCDLTYKTKDGMYILIEKRLRRIETVYEGK